MKFDILKVTSKLTNRQIANALTGIGMAATPVTAVWSGFAGKRLADLLESYKARERAGEDIPWQTKFIEIAQIVGGPALLCIIGMTCTWGANRVNAVEIAALATSCAAYKKNAEKGKCEDSRIPEKTENKQTERLDQTVIKEDYMFNPEILFSDGETGTTFMNSELYIDKTLYEIKYKISHDDWRGDVTYKTFADQLGFQVPDKYDEYGWEQDEFHDVEAEIKPTRTTDGRPAFGLYFNIEPHKLEKPF